MCLLELPVGEDEVLSFRVIFDRKIIKKKKKLGSLCTRSLAVCYAVETEVVLFFKERDLGHP